MTAILTPHSRPESRSDAGVSGGYNIAMGRLRAFIVALVVAHHAVLAYHPWAPPPANSLVGEPRWWEAFPTIDPQRWAGWALFTGFNDIFFMALMFFLSGLFVWRSLQRKGTARFTRDRFVRLGLPFVIAAGVLAPLAYYPAYLQTTPTPAPAGFWQQWRALGTWPAGPAWFLWVLLAFGCIAAGLRALAPRCVEIVNNSVSPIFRRPLVCFVALTLLSSVAYVPMSLVFSPLDWKAWGPFAFQTSRIFHYAVYFAAGAIVGAGSGEESLLSRSGPLARRWILWPARALAAFAASSVLAIIVMAKPVHPRFLDAASDAGFTLSCAASTFACLSLFLRFAKTREPLLEKFSACSYGIYLVHYPIVNWLQHALLSFSLGAFLKGVVVAIGGIALSWLLIWALRRSRAIASII